MSLVGVVVGMVVRVIVVVIMIMAAVRPMDMRLGADALVVAMPMVRIAMMGVIVIMRAVAMIMVIVIMMVVAVVMPMRRRRRDIGAPFRVEWRFDLDNACAEAPRHIFDHMIAPDAQALFQQFGRQVTVAQMPGDSHKRGRVGGANLRQLLRRGDDFDDPSVLKRQPVAGAQHHGVRQVEQKSEAAHAGHCDAPAIALVIFKDDRVGRLAGP